MAFKDNLKKYREHANFSAKEFANKVGCAYTTYLTYENHGREPKYSTLVKIANMLNVTIDELLDNRQSELDKALSFCKKYGYSIVPSEKMLEIYKKNLPDENVGLSPNAVSLIPNGSLKPLLNDKEIIVGPIRDLQGNITDLPNVIDPKTQIIHINNEDLIKLVQSILNNKALHIQLNDILTSKLTEYYQKDIIESGMRNLNNFRENLDRYKDVDPRILKHIDRVLKNWKIAKNQQD